MLPTWMIEELEKARRERERQVAERPTLWVELPEERHRPSPAPRAEVDEPRQTVIVIEY